MRKFYSVLALSAMVALSASAEKFQYDGKSLSTNKAVISAELIGKKEMKKAPAKTPALEDLTTLNLWTYNGLLEGNTGSQEGDLNVSITDEGTVKIELLGKSNFTIYGTYDAAEGTLSLPNMQLMFSDQDGPVYFYLKGVAEDGSLISGASDATAVVGTFENGAVEFPPTTIWAAGDPAQENLGWYFLSSDNNFAETYDPFGAVCELCSDATFKNNIVYGQFFKDNPENTEYVEVEVYTNGEGYYKVIDPFKSLYAGLNINSASPEMIIDATAPEAVLIPLQSTGLSNSTDGAYLYTSFEFYQEPTADQLIKKTVEGNVVTITFPFRSCLLATSKSGNLYYANLYESVLKFTDSRPVNVQEVEEADAPVVYYNLQGTRVANPEGLVIRVQNGKATKLLVK